MDGGISFQRERQAKGFNYRVEFALSYTVQPNFKKGGSSVQGASLVRRAVLTTPPLYVVPLPPSSQTPDGKRGGKSWTVLSAAQHQAIVSTANASAANPLPAASPAPSLSGITEIKPALRFRDPAASASTPAIFANELPDPWEEQYFQKVGVDPDGDPDGDGVSNADEHRRGSDPTDFYDGVEPAIKSLVPPDGSLIDGHSIAVSVADSSGRPLANAPVRFTARGDQHGLSPTLAGRWDKACRQIVVRADALGVARAYVVRADELVEPLK